MVNKIRLIIFLGMYGTFSYAQEGRMETDRPDQTESPFITKKKYVQVEMGFNFEKENKLNTIAHPGILWKYGVSKRFEFRLVTEFISQELPFMLPDENKVTTGLLPAQLGGKVALWEEKGLLPKTSFIFHIIPPTLGSKTFHADQWAPRFRFTFQNSLSENIGIGYNLGAEWDGFSPDPYWTYTFSPGFTFGENWYGYIEVFGAIRKNEEPHHAIDGGLAYYFNDNIKIDLSASTGIINSPDYVALGFSFRFH